MVAADWAEVTIPSLAKGFAGIADLHTAQHGTTQHSTERCSQQHLADALTPQVLGKLRGQQRTATTGQTLL